eukprot:TRINITY_DN10263_c0_g1_i2.p1 TRINITY_DN10263_c0_g1~~TRINITY_DN10263_c0_g1_i2.p1  ORF type:complete len:1014 (+),score=196.88 TRINITY_DN10263_c0_g1_i2:29-3043(+)
MTSIDVFVPAVAAYSGRYEQVGENEWEKGDLRLYNSKGMYWTFGTLSDVAQGIGWVAACHEHGGRPPWEMSKWRYYAAATGAWVESSDITVRKSTQSTPSAIVPNDPPARWRVIGGGGAVIRESESLSSPIVKTLPQGVVLSIVELRGRRARVQSPPGWVSITAATGEVIMTPHTADLYSNFSTSPALSPQRTPQTTMSQTPGMVPSSSPVLSVPPSNQQATQPGSGRGVLSTERTGESTMQMVLPLKIQYSFNVEVDNNNPNLSITPTNGGGYSSSKRVIGIEAGIPILQPAPATDPPQITDSASHADQRPPPVSPAELPISSVDGAMVSLPQNLQSCASEVQTAQKQSTVPPASAVHTSRGPVSVVSDADVVIKKSEVDYYSAPSQSHVSAKSAPTASVVDGAGGTTEQVSNIQSHPSSHSVQQRVSVQPSHVTAPTHSTSHVTAPSHHLSQQSSRGSTPLVRVSEPVSRHSQASHHSIPQSNPSGVPSTKGNIIDDNDDISDPVPVAAQPSLLDKTVPVMRDSQVSCKGSTKEEMEQTFATAIEQTTISSTPHAAPATPPVSEHRNGREKSVETRNSDQSPFPDSDVPVAVVTKSDLTSQSAPVAVESAGGPVVGNPESSHSQNSHTTKPRSDPQPITDKSLTGTWYVETKNCGEHADSSYTIDMWHEPGEEGLLRGEYIRGGGGPPLPVRGVYNEKWRVAEIKVSWGAGQTSTMRLHVDQNPPSAEETATTMRGTFTNDYDHTKGDITAVVVSERLVKAESLQRQSEPISGSAYSELPMPVAVSAEWHNKDLSLADIKTLSQCIERDISAAIGCDVTQVAIVGSGSTARLRLHSVPGGVPPGQLKQRYEALEAHGNLPLPESKAILRTLMITLPVHTPDEYLHPALHRHVDASPVSRSPYGNFSQSPNGVYSARQSSTSPYGIGVGLHHHGAHTESNFSSPARSNLNMFSPVSRLSPARPPKRVQDNVQQRIEEIQELRNSLNVAPSVASTSGKFAPMVM